MSYLGAIDEIRLSDTERSANWIKTGYADQNDPVSLRSVTAEETIVSGTVYNAAGTVPLGAGVPVALSIDGASDPTPDYYFMTTTAANGSFRFAVPVSSLSAGARLAVFIDNDGSSRHGVTVSVTGGGSVSGLDVFQDRLTVRNDYGSGITNASLASAYNGDFADLLYTVSGSDISVADGTVFYIPSGYVFSTGTNLLTIGTAGTGSGIKADGTLSTAADLTVFGNLSGIGTFDAGTNPVAVDVSGSVSVGTFTATAGTTTVGGNFTPGSFTHNGGTVEFSGTGSVGSYGFNNLTISGGTRTAGGDLTVSGALTLSGGTFDPGNGTHSVAGNWSDAGAVFRPSSGTIVLTGANPQISSDAANNFCNLMVTNGASLWSGITVKGSLEITGGTLAAGTHEITISGDWTNSAGVAGFDPGTGTVTFVDNARLSTVSGSNNFYDFNWQHGRENDRLRIREFPDGERYAHSSGNVIGVRLCQTAGRNIDGEVESCRCRLKRVQ